MKQILTDKFIRALKPAPQGKRAEYWDSRVDGFGVRVTDKGAKSFVLFKRWPPNGVPARRFIGDADILSLAEARGIAADWIHQIALGKDPKAEKEKARLEEQQNRMTTFGFVAEQWFREVVRKQRQGRAVEREVRRAFVSIWGQRPIADITKLDVRTYTKDKAAETPAMARNHLGQLKQLFGWAVDQDCFGLTDDNNPIAALTAKKLIGKKVVRKRVLNNAELRALWHAAQRTPYPYGPLIRMLILTGQRKSEVADAVWSEFDFATRLWTIPAKRMKMDSAHVVPLTDGVLEILEGLPRFKRGNHLFSTSYGVATVDGFSRAKERLDKLMAEELGHPPEHFTIHDIRRTMRTGLSALPIPDVVRERVVAHAAGGMHAVYDQWSYLDEKRRALELWEARLRGIVTPSDNTNVVPLHATGFAKQDEVA
jgi:integrase